MLQGETGTGKELAARALHAWSGRTGPFVAVNCGALPEQLAESELFGVRRGAYTGAIEDRPGLLRASSGGTLLLDEVGELPATLQVKLLRVLQENEVQPVGAAQPVRVDLRVVTATHRDLAALVEEGTFRGDLFARLTGLEVELPPLCDRRADLGLLIPTLLRRAGAPADVRFSREAARALFRWRWPHNVRELEKALALAVALSGAGRIELTHLPEVVRTAPEPRPDPLAGHAVRPLSEADVTRRTELIELLRAHHGNVSAVARQMGVARMQNPALVPPLPSRPGQLPRRLRRHTRGCNTGGATPGCNTRRGCNVLHRAPLVPLSQSIRRLRPGTATALHWSEVEAARSPGATGRRGFTLPSPRRLVFFRFRVKAIGGQ